MSVAVTNVPSPTSCLAGKSTSKMQAVSGGKRAGRFCRTNDRIVSKDMRYSAARGGGGRTASRHMASASAASVPGGGSVASPCAASTHVLAAMSWSSSLGPSTTTPPARWAFSRSISSTIALTMRPRPRASTTAWLTLTTSQHPPTVDSPSTFPQRSSSLSTCLTIMTLIGGFGRIPSRYRANGRRDRHSGSASGESASSDGLVRSSQVYRTVTSVGATPLCSEQASRPCSFRRRPKWTPSREATRDTAPEMTSSSNAPTWACGSPTFRRRTEAVAKDSGTWASITDGEINCIGLEK
mmetsp:Transcript_6672/g.21590  ORF Transcript_6672/g.21590 Transcript_6672/m.21590 type:complete len:297 (+) Transcript_6672:1590-2480(+)